MKTFVRVVELWLLDINRTRLTLASGIYGECEAFRVASQSMTFGYNEGLPGRAWAQRHPVILTKFEGSYFQRTEIAKAAGLTCGVALPVFSGEFLTGVVVLFCGDSEDHVGAIELWRNNPSDSPEMRLVDGYFGTADMFEFNARHTTFLRGYGLPGRTWKARAPVLIQDLHSRKAFLRWDQAQEIGINVGLGIPYEGASDETWIIAFLSALNTPIAKRIELWERHADGKRLIFSAGYCQTQADLGTILGSNQIERGEGAIGHTWLTGTPVVLDGDLSSDDSISGRAARDAGMSSIVALPIIRFGELRSIVAWYI